MDHGGNDFQRLREFVRDLRQAWIARPEDAQAAAAAATLRLTDRAAEARERPGAPRHIAVIGPTQVGKSSVVNHILGIEAADVSPLAGHTTQAHGFQGGGPDIDEWIATAFPDLVICPSHELPRERLDALGFQRVAADCGATVVWDTPDFDSAESGAYRAITLDLVGLADIVVVVLSREKYADMTVWTLLEQMAPLRRELFVCLNKMTPDAEGPVRASLLGRLRERFGNFSEARLFVIPQASDTSAQRDSAGVRAMRTALANATEADVDLSARARRDLAAMARANWPEWTAPIVAEQAGRDVWDALVDSALADGFAHYVSDFLNHPERYDAFRRATVELLNLLELPGVAGALSKVRSWVTWPARQLWNAGQRRLSQRDGAHAVGAELTVLHGVIDRVLMSLSRDVARRQAGDKAAPRLWQALTTALDARHEALVAAMRAQAAQSCEQFEPEIHAAANRLFQQLQQRPRLLATLRAARGVTDAAAIALAVKTGGSPIHDVVLAPALLGISSFMTEGALGSYMRTVADDLKRRREQAVRQTLFQEQWGAALHEFIHELRDAGLFGVSPARMTAAEESMQRLERGGK